MTLITDSEQAAIIEALRYDPDTGIFYWRDFRRRKKETAGHCGKDGYVRIMFNYRMYSAAPLAWFLYYGEWPTVIVDHEDRNRSNNRINNLRLSNHAKNAMNSGLRVDSKYEVKGIYQDNRTGTWYVKIGQTFLGSYKSREAAVQARREAENAYTY